MTKKEIKIDLFESDINIFWNCKPSTASQYLKKKYPGLPKHVSGWLDDKNNWRNQGVCLSDAGNSSNIAIWLSQNPKKTTKGQMLLSHEASHAAYALMNHWGIDVDDNSQEIMAMIIGNIVGQSLK